MDPAAAPLVRTVTRADGVRDRVAVEEPLEIRVGGVPLAVTMRTPGHDEELALGFLVGEGLIGAGDDVRAAPPADLAANTIEVTAVLPGDRAAEAIEVTAVLSDDRAAEAVDVTAVLRRDPGARSFYTTSSCGVCGKGALEEVAVDAPLLPDGPVVPRALLASLPDRLRQPGFVLTGGLHATGLFSVDGDLLVLREDVGRHNAFDKVVGRALLDGALPLRDRLVCVSGRLWFELVQKAVVAGCPVLVGVGAPTSLAVSLAADRRLTLCGFARGGSMNVYTDFGRVG